MSIVVDRTKEMRTSGKRCRSDKNSKFSKEITRRNMNSSPKEGIPVNFVLSLEIVPLALSNV